METGVGVTRSGTVDARIGPPRTPHTMWISKHALAPLSRADRKIICRRAAGSCVGEVPPLAVVICQSLFSHGLDQHVSPAPLFGGHGGARRGAPRTQTNPSPAPLSPALPGAVVGR